jgi:hypothetical protein
MGGVIERGLKWLRGVWARRSPVESMMQNSRRRQVAALLIANALSVGWIGRKTAAPAPI